MDQLARPRGRPNRYAKYADLEASLPKVMEKRPAYCDKIGLFRGQRAFTVWVKVRMARGGDYKGRSYKPGESVEIKLGDRASWEWGELEHERDRLQRLAARQYKSSNIACSARIQHVDPVLMNCNADRTHTARTHLIGQC